MEHTEEDIFKTLKKPSSGVLLKERKSKFYAYGFPVTSKTDIKEYLSQLQKKHPTANHICYAWQLGIKQPTCRVNDDGEPNNSAGMPIYGQIQAFSITNVLIAVVRVFGGTKLGVGGLIQAYRNAAKLMLASSDIVERTIQILFKLNFEYAQLDVVMRTIKRHNAKIVSQEMSISCCVTITIREKNAATLQKEMNALQGIKVIQQH